MERRQIGDEAERRVVRFLEAGGYTIRDRNVSLRHGELDVVAEKGPVLAFVEVRMRSSDHLGLPAESVLGPKQRKVVKAAAEYCQRARLFERVIRFDVASVVGRGEAARVEYIEDAFEAWF